MNAKLRALTEALINEVNASNEAEDVEPSKIEWWQQLEWGSPDYRTLFNSLGKETQKRIIDAGLCPTCGDDLKIDGEEIPASEDTIDDCPDGEDAEKEIKRVAAEVEDKTLGDIPPADVVVPFDVEASQKVTERSKAKIKELDL